jgi:transposase-like protein
MRPNRTFVSQTPNRSGPASTRHERKRFDFPTDDAAGKLIWLALRNITADWGKAAHHWKEAMNQFAILYAERFTREA